MQSDCARRALLYLAIAACAASLVGTLPSRASACGGLFCNQAQPVLQDAERIIFAENGDGTVTAIIEIQYTGPSRQFSWVLPVPGVPDVEVSSVQALDRMQRTSDPTYQLNTVFRQDCAPAPTLPTAGGFAASAGSGGTAGAAGAASPPVIVLAEGTVGPFDYEVISLDPSLPEPADVAIEWLMDNGYDVTALAPDVLGPYLSDGLNLIAFRLTKDSDSGSIRPIRLTYDAELPFIPIRPTAVAATEDMGILVWVLGAERAIPKNYKHLELNEARINWFAFRSSYDDVINDAADEAGGQGFVTEMSDATSTFSNVIVQQFERSQWSSIGSGTFADAFDMLNTARSFSQWDGFSDAVGSAVTLPADVTVQDFIGCPECYRADPALVFDMDALRMGLWDKVVKPMFDTQDLVDSQPSFTRFYTTMSADEMTVDPSFDFNPDLPTVSNSHVATRYFEDCTNTSWYAELPQGTTVWGSGNVWPMDDEQPAALKILQLGTTGSGEMVQDNTERVMELLAATNPRPDLAVDDPSVSGSSGSTRAGSGASAAGSSGSSAAGNPAIGSGGSGADTGLEMDDESRSNACGCRVPGGTGGNGGGALLLLGLAGTLLSRRRWGAR